MGDCDWFLSHFNIFAQPATGIWCSTSQSVNHISYQSLNVSQVLICQLCLRFQLTSQNVLRNSDSPLCTEITSHVFSVFSMF